MKEAKLKERFIQYLKDHPEERFWQAVRNFWGADFVTITTDKDTRDTFYIESEEEDG